MTNTTIFFIAISLAMDAFAVSVTNGSRINKIETSHILIFGLYFGIFQFIMPIIGFLAGNAFSQYIVRYDHWIAFFLLSVIGGKMFFETFKEEKSEPICCDDICKAKNMILLALATSIDAMAVGVTFSVTNVNVFTASLIIGVVAFVLSCVGVFFGEKLGSLIKSNAERFGGIVLFAIGTKILIEHLIQK